MSLVKVITRRSLYNCLLICFNKLQEDISGWTNKDKPSGLQLHDMVICVNGKSVGCITEAELQIDLDICGSEMMLVVARFDIKGNTNQDVTLEDLAMDWNDIGAGAPPRKKVVCFEGEESSDHRHELNTQPNVGMMNVSSQGYHPGSIGSQDDDDVSNEEESESDDDDADTTDDALSLNWKQQLASELESKSDEELMEKLIETTESRSWTKNRDSNDYLLAKVIAKRGFLAAAKDERIQKLSRDSDGITRDQVIEWMSKSETFKQYEQIMRAKWSQALFTAYVNETLKAVGYAKISGGGGNRLARWALPDDIVPCEPYGEDVLSQDEQSDEDDSESRKQGSRKVDASVSVLESKTDEELTEMLREGINSGEGPKLVKLVTQRACLAAAQDENIQRLHSDSGGVTKAQIIEWMDRSETFTGYKEMVRTNSTEAYLMNRLSDALKIVGYVRFGNGTKTRWALPKHFVPRVESLNLNDDATPPDVEDVSSSPAKKISKQQKKFTPEVSKSDEELMEMLSERIKSGEWGELANIATRVE